MKGEGEGEGEDEREHEGMGERLERGSNPAVGAHDKLVDGWLNWLIVFVVWTIPW